MISVQALSFRYADQPVLDNLDLELNGGEIMVLSGRSGVGKTTLARLIAGLEAPASGTIEIDGKQMHLGHSLVPPHLRSISMVFQRPALWSHMTIEQHLKFVMPRHTLTRDQEINAILEMTGLNQLRHRRPHQLSEGQARRVALARAFSAASRYIIMDEPLSNLDPDARESLIELIRNHAQTKRTGLLYITHDEHEAHSIGGKRCWLDKGKVKLMPVTNLTATMKTEGMNHVD